MRIVLADLRSTDGFVNKDTIVGGFGARMRGFSWTTRLIERMRKFYQDVPSIHAGYLAAIFSAENHEVVFTRDEVVEGDLALVLTSIVDYRHEIRWAQEAKRKFGMTVGFFGAMATHAGDVFKDQGDFIIKGEPEHAALRLAKGERFAGAVDSPAVGNLDTLPFPAWHLMMNRFDNSVVRSVLHAGSVFPVMSSRSCPEFCTYCPHRITAPFRARSVENVIEEIEELCQRYRKPSVIFRDPLFTEDRERTVRMAEGMIRKNLQVRFQCETRLDDLDAPLLNLLHRAGLHTITFGVESMDAETLKRVGRRPIPSAHQSEIVRHCRALGIQTHGFYVFGFLNDTAESIRATIDYAIELGSTFALFKILTPYPGTPLRKQMESRITETDLEKFDGYTLTFDHPNLKAEELRFLLGSAYSRFYVRPSWGWTYFGQPGYAEWLRRMDDYTRRQQLAHEVSVFTSPQSKARPE